MEIKSPSSMALHLTTIGIEINIMQAHTLSFLRWKGKLNLILKAKRFIGLQRTNNPVL